MNYQLQGNNPFNSERSPRRAFPPDHGALYAATGARPKRAQVMERRTRVVELASAGLDYDEIAAELGYANRSGAGKAHQRALATHQAETVQVHRSLELESLDALQLAVWDKATSGDIRSVLTVLRIIHRRIRLLGLDSGKPGGKPEDAMLVVLPSFWVHAGAVHAGDWRSCRCPEIVGSNVDEDEIAW